MPVALVMRYREPTMLEAREGQCQNVSQSGMCILTPKPSPRGALVRFECVSGGTVEGIRGTGRVVWQRGTTDARGPAAMGVRFVRLEPGCAEALEDLLEQLGRERLPSSVPPPQTGSDRPPGRDAPTPTGITQQGMGAARNRSLHYPTLRGMPASSPPAGDAASSAVQARMTLPQSGDEPAHRSSPRPPMRPGQATIVGTPAPPSQHSTPGGLRERLDRTRRGMPAPASEAASDEPVSRATWPAASAASESPTPKPDGDRPPPTDYAGDPDSRRTGAGAGEVARDEHGDGHSHRAPSDTPAEPRNSTGTRRRAARAAEISAIVPALPDPDATPKRNWIPWVVVGSGLLFSALIVSAFGTLPPGLLGKTATDTTRNDPAASQPPDPQALAATDKPAKGPPSDKAATDTAARYVLEVKTEPPGARVSAAGKWVLAPGTLELGQLDLPIQVRAEFSANEVATVTVSPEAFERDGDKLVHRIELKHPPKAAEQSKTASSPGRSPREDATPEAPEAARAQPKPAAEKTKPAEEDEKPAVEKTKAAAEKPATAAEPQRAPQIAQPPVPIAAVAAAPDGASSGDTRAAAATDAQATSASSATTSNGPLDVALECLTRGDNACVIAALQNRAKSERELAVLIETYRAVGNASDAERYMRRYLEAYPNGKRALDFRRLLERRSETGSEGAVP